MLDAEHVGEWLQSERAYRNKILDSGKKIGFKDFLIDIDEDQKQIAF